MRRLATCCGRAPEAIPEAPLSAMDIVCRPVTTPSEREEAWRIRHEVFVREQGVPESEERDRYDDEAFHVLVWDGPQAVGTARLVEVGEGKGKIGRVAVLAQGRGRGLGQWLMQALHERAGERGLHTLVLDAQLSALTFYERLGYQPEGEIFLDCAIEHQRMTRSLA